MLTDTMTCSTHFQRLMNDWLTYLSHTCIDWQLLNVHKISLVPLHISLYANVLLMYTMYEYLTQNIFQRMQLYEQKCLYAHICWARTLYCDRPFTPFQNKLGFLLKGICKFGKQYYFVSGSGCAFMPHHNQCTNFLAL